MPKQEKSDSDTDMPDILIVDDESANLKLLCELLAGEGYKVRPADSPQLAVESALGQPPGLILLDVKMPKMDGFEVCRRLKSDKRTNDIPIIFVTAMQDIQDKVQGFEAGGVDFISKPFQEEEILARVRTHLELRNMQLDLEALVDKRTAELAKSEAKYRSLIDNSLIGVFTTTHNGYFTFVNDAMVNMFDFGSPQMMLGQRFRRHWKDLKDRDRMLAELQTLGSVINFEAETISHSGKQIQILLSAKMIGNDILGMVMDITDRKQDEIKLQNAYSEIKKLKNQLEADQTYLREEIKLTHNHENIIGNSEKLKYVLFRVEQIAPTDTTVLILGESGTGKELIARAIHNAGQRKDRPLIKVDCASLPSNLIESELFGHEKGAFTGADSKRVGRFELGDGATIFLDEIGDLPIELQPKLLRVLQDGEFERLGSSKTQKTDVRIIAATNRNLEKDTEDKKFRLDLFYRLSVYTITIPPLRDRSEDISMLVNYMIRKFQRKLGKRIRSVPKKIITTLQNYPWPGNVREFENVIQSAVINTQGDALQIADNLTPGPPAPVAKSIDDLPLKTLETVERDHIMLALKRTNWQIEGKSGAAKLLDINSSTLRGRMRKLNIHRPVRPT